MTAHTELHQRDSLLEAKAEIHDCMTRYARGMDRRDRDLLGSAYCDGPSTIRWIHR